MSDILLSIRTELDLNQVNFGQMLGVSSTYISCIERGKTLPTATEAFTWAKILGYSSAMFMTVALRQQLNLAGINKKIRITIF